MLGKTHGRGRVGPSPNAFCLDRLFFQRGGDGVEGLFHEVRLGLRTHVSEAEDLAVHRAEPAGAEQPAAAVASFHSGHVKPSGIMAAASLAVNTGCFAISVPPTFL